VGRADLVYIKTLWCQRKRLPKTTYAENGRTEEESNNVMTW
jgi:hypothetical protein